MFQLLSGLKVVDLTTIVLGPYATQILGDFGADVVKVESADGDLFRAVRPGRSADVGVQFQNFNRNKNSIVLDLKQADAQAILHKLVSESDVVVHNMRSRSAERLGASFDELRRHNPQLVYCYAPGFADGGPSQDDPAYDDIIQARCGLAALNADSEGAPQFVRSIVCDKVVGLHLAIAVLTGVIHRMKTGEGVCIEAPMLETMTAFLMSEHLAGHSMVPPEGELGYARMLSPHRQPYRTRDGYLAILPYSTRHWVRFFSACDEPALAGDQRVTDPELRSEKIDELYQEIARIAPSRTSSEWLTLLRAEDIPCSPVNQLTDLQEDPQLVASGVFETFDDPELGMLKQLRSPFRLHAADAESPSDSPAVSATDPTPLADRRAPGLGAHTREILTRLGYDDEQINALQASGSIA
jgi:crotonobetainyl-CoA:carnitine CoA-transferase CaiB-like acyl-CoA transferase